MTNQPQVAKVKYYGFDYPPIGILNLLNQYNINRSVYIIDPLNGQELPYIDITPNDLIIITTHEGASYQWFDRLLDKLINVCCVPKKNILLRSACLRDPDSPIARVHTIADEANDTIVRYNNLILHPPTHHYVCLNRLHRWQRYELVKGIIDNDLLKYGAVSYSDGHFNFPLIVDYANVSYSQGHVFDHPKIQGALFNIITETAYESNAHIKKSQEHPLPGMSEKTFKAFILGQIPVWAAPYKSVECYRQLGFDVFDDIIDHSYDNTVDPEKRITQIINVIKNICLIDVNELSKLKTKLESRFKHNFKRLKFLAGNHQWEKPQWDTWLRLTDTTPTVSSGFK